MVEDLSKLSLLEYNESATRTNIIDELLKQQGWMIGYNCLIEDKVNGIDSPTGEGYSDYVLYDKDRRVLAVIEAKRTSINPMKGYSQAKAYADYYQSTDIEGRRPVIYLTNGLAILMVDGTSPIRSVAGFYSQEDLHTFFNLKREMEPSLVSVEPDKEIAGRDYQVEAVKYVFDRFSEGRRKSLLIMATGSGKTRVAASIADSLIKFHWAKNILFFADRKKLVEQAHDRFEASLPAVTRTMIYGDNPKPNLDARIVVSTYPSMDALLKQNDEYGRMKYSPGHFHLVILDEVHRSVYQKYRKVFEYFDARVVGLTATPRKDVDHDTYEMFEITADNPAYEYEYAEGVAQGYLKPYLLKDIDLNFYRNGVRFSDLSPRDQEIYSKEFVNKEGEVPEFVPPRDFLHKVISADSIRKVLDKLMKEGLYIDFGTRLGKTIIFASSHAHAEAIREEFYRMLPGMHDEYCVIIDYQSDNGNLMKKFTDDDDSVTRIAISVDMLDTGVDVPCILNLVFFKPIYSYVKFWQMIGRGTRPCKGLIDGRDKEHFLIFDFCGNFKAFEENPGGIEVPVTIPLNEAVFGLRVKFIQLLQSGEYQHLEYQEIREYHINKALESIDRINLANYDIGTDRAYILAFSSNERFKALSEDDIDTLTKYVAPHVPPMDGHVSWERFDNLMLTMCVTSMLGHTPVRQYSLLRRKMYALYTECATLGQVKPHLELIHDILQEDYIERCQISELENIRGKLRTLMDLVKHDGDFYYTTLSDIIVGEKGGLYTPTLDSFSNFRKDFKKTVNKMSEEPVLMKIRCNIALDDQDRKELYALLLFDAGKQEEFNENYGDSSLVLLSRRILHLDRSVAENIFSKYLFNSSLTQDQIFFIKEVIEHVVLNGVVQKKKLGTKPFTNKGSVNEIFKNDKNALLAVIHDIDELNKNADYDGVAELGEL